MSLRPHDSSDLFLAPVMLELNERIDELGRLDPKALADKVALESDLADWTRDLREASLLRAVGHLVETHGWILSWDPRGVRLSHAGRHLVLGIPDSFRAYVSGAPVVTREARRTISQCVG